MIMLIVTVGIIVLRVNIVENEEVVVSQLMDVHVVLLLDMLVMVSVMVMTTMILMLIMIVVVVMVEEEMNMKVAG